MPLKSFEPPDSAPRLYGLVLAGGRSTRMGTDKGGLDYHGVPQVRWAFGLLLPHCEGAVVSVRDSEQASEPVYAGLPVVLDLESGAGPAAGLVAALRREPQSAWFVVAADMPLLDDELLRELVAQRDAAAIATAYRHSDGTLEPLCTIWEPSSLPLLEAERAKRGSASLRRVLETGTVRIVIPRDPLLLSSVNTSAEDSAARSYLARGRSPVKP